MRRTGNRQAIVIGGGIHGITTALAIADAGVKVVVVERNDGILQGTSGATHNRAHMGYHYPRSLETAQECLRGLVYFESNYPEALYRPEEAYYLIEKNESLTGTEDYIKFCNEMHIPYERKWPSAELLSREYVESSFLVPEPCFNLKVLRQLLTAEAKAKDVVIKTGSTVIRTDRDINGIYNVSTNTQTPHLL